MAPQSCSPVSAEMARRLALDRGFVIGDNFAPRLFVEVGIRGKSVEVLEVLEDVLERAVIDAQNDIAVHLNKTAITVEREARIARELSQSFDGPVVEPEIKDGVHHAGHRGSRTGPDRDQKRPLLVSKTGGDGLPDHGEGLHHVARKASGNLFPAATNASQTSVVIVKSGRRGKAERRHLREVGALAAK